MNIFLENIWLWFGLAFVVGGVGYGFFLNNRKILTLGLAVASPLLVLAMGFSLYFLVDTDHKSVARLLNRAAGTIERDNVPSLLDCIHPEAEKTRKDAERYMEMARVSSVRFTNLKIVVNDLTFPPVAKATFTATVYWQPRRAIEGFVLDRPMLERISFTIELMKTEHSWLVTDCDDLRFRSMRERSR